MKSCRKKGKKPSQPYGVLRKPRKIYKPISEDKIDHIAKILDMDPEDYRCAKKVYFDGIQELIDAMNYEKIPLRLAAEISEFPKSKQQERLNKWFEQNESLLH